MRTYLQAEQQRARSLLRACFRLFFITTSIVGAFFLFSIALAKAMQRQGVSNRIRQFNKQTLNPLTLKIAGNRLRIYALLKHVGRRSGRAYSTPVVAVPLGDGFVIPLPYGKDVDWLQNVLAAGTCTLIRNKQEYILERPEILEPKKALDAYPWSQRFIFSAGGIKHYLWLHQHAEVLDQAIMETASKSFSPSA